MGERQTVFPASPERVEALLKDLRDLGGSPLSYGQETHGELHDEAVIVVTGLVDALFHLNAAYTGRMDQLNALRSKQ